MRHLLITTIVFALLSASAFANIDEGNELSHMGGGHTMAVMPKNPLPDAHMPKTEWPAEKQAAQAVSGPRHTITLAQAQAMNDLAPAAGGSEAATSMDAATTTTTAPAVATPTVSQPQARDGEIIESKGGDAIPALPLQIMQAGEYTFVTGGVGDEELAQLRSTEHNYNVRLLIAGMKGEYIGDASIRVRDMKDQGLFTASDAGPYFYVSLPSGSYIFEITTADGNMKAIKVNVPSKGFVKPVVRF